MGRSARQGQAQSNSRAEKASPMDQSDSNSTSPNLRDWRRQQPRESPRNKHLIISSTLKRKKTQDFDTEEEIEEKVLENLTTLVELQELRKRTTSAEAIKAQERKELTCLRTMENLRELCEEENLHLLARKCANASASMKDWENQDGYLNTNFTIPRVTTPTLTKVKTLSSGNVRKKLKSSNFQGRMRAT